MSRTPLLTPLDISNESVDYYVDYFIHLRKDCCQAMELLEQSQALCETSVWDAVQELRDQLQLQQKTLLATVRNHYCHRQAALTAFDAKVRCESSKWQTRAADQSSAAEGVADDEGVKGQLRRACLQARRELSFIVAPLQRHDTSTASTPTTEDGGGGASDSMNGLKLTVDLSPDASSALSRLFILPAELQTLASPPPLPPPPAAAAPPSPPPPPPGAPHSPPPPSAPLPSLPLPLPPPPASDGDVGSEGIEHTVTPREIECDLDRADLAGLSKQGLLLPNSKSVVQLSSGHFHPEHHTNNCTKSNASSGSHCSQDQINATATITGSTGMAVASDGTGELGSKLSNRRVEDTDLLRTSHALVGSSAAAVAAGAAARNDKSSDLTPTASHTGAINSGNNARDSSVESKTCSALRQKSIISTSSCARPKVFRKSRKRRTSCHNFKPTDSHNTRRHNNSIDLVGNSTLNGTSSVGYQPNVSHPINDHPTHRLATTGNASKNETSFYKDSVNQRRQQQQQRPQCDLHGTPTDAGHIVNVDQSLAPAVGSGQRSAGHSVLGVPPSTAGRFSCSTATSPGTHAYASTTHIYASATHTYASATHTYASATSPARNLLGIDKILSISNMSLQSSLSGSNKKVKPLHIERSAVVSAIVSPSLFYFQRGADTQRLEKLSQHLNAIAPTTQTVAVPYLGVVYLAQFCPDNKWYRAQVITMVGVDHVAVHYVDYGNEETLPVSRLRVCPENYRTKKLPSFAVASGLWGLMPALPAPPSGVQNSQACDQGTEDGLRFGPSVVATPEWSEAAQRLFSELMTHGRTQVFLMAVEKTPRRRCLVEVRREAAARGVVADEAVSVRQVLLELGLAMLDPVVAGHEQPWSSASSPAPRRYFKPDLVTSREEVCVYLTCFNSPHHFYVQLDGPSYSEQLDALHDKMQVFYDRITCSADWILYLPRIGQPCVARSSANNTWYRARVEEVLPPTPPPDKAKHRLDQGRSLRSAVSAKGAPATAAAAGQSINGSATHADSYNRSCSSNGRTGRRNKSKMSTAEKVVGSRCLTATSDEGGQRLVRVCYVDYGRTETLPYRNLRKIKDAFLELPAQALHCRLADVEPLKAAAAAGEEGGGAADDAAAWDPETRAVVEAFMETLTASESFSAIFHSVEGSGRSVVSIFVRPDTCNTLDLAHHLVQLGYVRLAHSEGGGAGAGGSSWSSSAVAGLDGQVIAQLNSFSSGSGEQRHNRTIRRAAGHQPVVKSCVTEVPCRPPSIGCRQAVSVLYLSLISPAAIFVRLAAHTHHYDQLQSELDAVVEREPGSDMPRAAEALAPLVGSLYIAVFSGQPFVARAKVLQTQEHDMVKVLLLDCGGVVSVAASSLRTLPPRLAALKPMALLVALHDIAPTGGQQKWPGTTTDVLRDLLSALSSLYLLKQGSSKRSPSLYHLKVLPVVLGYTAEVGTKDPAPFSAPPSTHRVSVSQQLVQAGLALPIRVTDSTVASSQDASSLSTLKADSVMDAANPFAPLEVPILPAPPPPTVARAARPQPAKEGIPPQPHESSQAVKGKSSNKEIVKAKPTGKEKGLKTATQSKSVNSQATHDRLEDSEPVWLPPVDLLTTTFSAIPTNVDEEALVYLHPLSSEHYLQLLRNSLLLQYRDSLPEFVTASEGGLQEGDAVIARYDLDNFWYRATIKTIMSDGEHVMVRFVDYGNTECVLVRNLRRSNMYSDLPVQCHACVLHGIKPLTRAWEEVVLDLLHMTIVEKRCRVSVMPARRWKQHPGLPRIELLVESTGLEVIKLLVDRLVVCRRSSSDDEDLGQGEDASHSLAPSLDRCSQSSGLGSRDAIFESDSEGKDGTTNASASDQQPFCDLSVNPHTMKKARLQQRLAAVPPLPLPPTHVLFPVQVSSIIDPATMYIATLFPDLSDADHSSLADAARGCDNDITGASGTCSAVSAMSDADEQISCSRVQRMGSSSDSVLQQRNQSQLQQYSHYKQLMKKVQLSAHQLESVSSPVCGGLYLCYLSYSYEWHRCQILEEVQPEDVEPDLLQEEELQHLGEPVLCVILLEFGCEEQIPVSRLRVMPAELRCVPAQSAYVRLMGISNGRSSGYWQTDTMAQMIQLVFAEDRQIYAVVREKKEGIEPHLVELYYKVQGVEGESDSLELCYQRLIDDGVFSYTEQHPQPE